MRIAVIAPPFIPVPPKAYGGTELFLAHLAEGLHERGHDVRVYANGESRVTCELKWRYADTDWPIRHAVAAQLKNHDHTAWAMADAAGWAEVVQINDTVAVPMTVFLDRPIVMTLHHPFEPVLSELYIRYPDVHYVAISRQQASAEPMPDITVVHHGIPLDEYAFNDHKSDYVVFLGRMAPCKGPHLAIEAAKRAGLRLKLAGEIQPTFREYWDREVRPLVDGDQIEYVGEADQALKNRLLAGARALLFPIQWNEPFGLVMVEAMACGTPVLALPGGSVAEVVRDGVSGWICRDVDELSARAASPQIDSMSCRAWVEAHFSCGRMVEHYIDLYERVAAGARRDGSELSAVGL